MSIKIATPISTLFNATSHLKEILNLSDALEIRDISKEVTSCLPRLYHSDLNIVEIWTEEEMKNALSIINKNKVCLASFHLSSCVPHPQSIDGIYQPNQKKFSQTQMMENVQKNIASIKSKLSNREVTLAIENNNYFPTGAYETVTEPKFINSVLEKFNLKLILDISHAEIAAHNRHLHKDDYVKNFNIENVFQIHLSHAKKTPELYTDAHLELEEEDWDNFKKILNRCPNVKFVTIEYYKNAQQLLEMLGKLRKILYEFQR